MSARIDTLVRDMISNSTVKGEISLSDPVYGAVMELRAWLFRRVYDKPGSVVATRRSEITWLGPNENVATPVVFTITDIGEDFYAWDLERCWGLEDVWG